MQEADGLLGAKKAGVSHDFGGLDAVCVGLYA